MPLPSNTQTGSRVPITVSYSDSIRLVHEQVHWTPKGVRLLTKWHFAVGSEVEFAFDHKGERHCCVGVVVSCHPLEQPEGYYQMVLYFIETPCTRLQKAACDCRLARDGNVPNDETHFTTSNRVYSDGVEPIARRGARGRS